MAVSVIRAVTPELRQPGVIVSPDDRIKPNEGGQLVLRLDIPLPDFADDTKSIYYRIEQRQADGTYQNVAGAGWTGAAVKKYRDPETGAFIEEAMDPTNPEHWSAILVELDGTHAFLKGSFIRAWFEVGPNPVTAGVIYERRTDPDML